MNSPRSPRPPVRPIALLSLMGLLTWMLSCAPAVLPPPTLIGNSNSMAAMDPTAKAVLDAFIGSLNNLDEERFLSLWEPDATAFFQFQDSPKELVGIDSIRAFIVPWFAETRSNSAEGPPYMNLVPENAKVTTIDNVGIVTFEVSGAAVTSRRTLILKYSPTGCRISHFHGSDMRRVP